MRMKYYKDNIRMLAVRPECTIPYCWMGEMWFADLILKKIKTVYDDLMPWDYGYKGSIKPGGNIRDCIREGILLAVQKETDVTLIHNNEKYGISLNCLLATIKENV